MSVQEAELVWNCWKVRLHVFFVVVVFIVMMMDVTGQVSMIVAYCVILLPHC